MLRPAPRDRARLGALAGALLTLAALSSACGPVTKGTSAVMLDEDGTLVTIVRTCSTRLDSVALVRAVGGVGKDDVELSRVDVDVDDDSSRTISMGVGIDDLDPALLLRTTPHTNDTYEVVPGVTFDVATLRSLAPTDVLVGTKTPISLDEFTAAPCHGSVWPAPTLSPDLSSDLSDSGSPTPG